jgi:hypothetical protein
MSDSRVSPRPRPTALRAERAISDFYSLFSATYAFARRRDHVSRGGEGPTTCFNPDCDRIRHSSMAGVYRLSGDFQLSDQAERVPVRRQDFP